MDKLTTGQLEILHTLSTVEGTAIEIGKKVRITKTIDNCKEIVRTVHRGNVYKLMVLALLVHVEQVNGSEGVYSRVKITDKGRALVSPPAGEQLMLKGEVYG